MIVKKSISLLTNMFNEETQLFSFSTTLKNGQYVNDFSHTGKYRYSVNVFVALQKLEQFYKIPWDLEQLIEMYISQHLSRDLNVANRGLFLHLLSLRNHKSSEEVYEWLEPKLKVKSKALKYNLQDISWALIGVTTYASQYSNHKALALARKILGYLLEDFINATTLVPKFNQSIRGRFVSFGGIAYFLMALERFAQTFDDDATRNLFKRALGQILKLQGLNGEWPWFIDSSTSKVMDWYQIYSVHQDSMAMLFLLPALDLGVEGAKEAIRKSYLWLFGNNELNKSLILKEPFFIYRSIRRSENFEREKRFLRSIKNCIFNKQAKRVSSQKLSINAECRSYHLGWILYAWSGRTGFNEFTELKLL